MLELLTAIPSKIPQYGASGVIALFGWGLAKNWLYTRGQVAEILASKVEILAAKSELVEIWKQIAMENQETIKLQANQISVLVAQTEAILSIVRELQNRPTKGVGSDL